MIWIFFSFFVVSPCSAQTTGYETTTAASQYCEAWKCEQHSDYIRILEQRVNDLAKGFQFLQTQNDELKSENGEIKAEIGELKAENKDLRDDVSHLQGLGLLCQTIRLRPFLYTILLHYVT